MVALYPWLDNYLEEPLDKYAKRLFRPVLATGSDIREAALEKLLRCLNVSAIKAGHTSRSAAAICDEFETHRVLQTGPHLMLILDPEAYYTHAFSLLGLRENGVATYVSYAVSTVKLEERARKGPGWLTITGRPVSLFGLSRNQMVPHSLLSRFDDLSFPSGLLNKEDRRNSTARDVLPRETFELPSQALKAANRALWPKIFGQRFSFLQIDDEDIADLCIEHLRDARSWLSTMLFGDGRLAGALLLEIDALEGGPWHGLLTRSTDYFWHYHDNKRLPLRLVDGRLVDPSTGMAAMRFSADAIADALAKRTLIPNLFLMFIMTAILPGVRVLGGSRHPLYYPLMRYVLCRALRGTESGEVLQRQLAADDLPCAWGHRVIEGRELRLAELLDDDHSWLSSLWADRQPLSNVSGGMMSFTTDKRWGELSSQIESKMIVRSDPQWAYA